jgi:multidrug efflux pump subunit AcrA (membrane-fusion protein)
MQLSSLLLTAAVSLVEFQGVPDAGGVVVDSCVVNLMDEVKLPADLPSQEAGVLTILRKGAAGADGALSWGERVSAGMNVAAGDLLGQIDNVMPGIMHEVAQRTLEIANKEAGNLVSVKYAEAAHDVAVSDYDTALATNEISRGTVTKTEIRRLVLLCKQYELQIEQAEYELEVAEISVKAQEAQLRAADADMARRNIVSPIDGIIVEVYPHEKEWVRPGEPIVHIVRMDQLRVEGKIDYSHSAGVVAGSTVKVTAVLPNGRPHVFTGQIDSVSPLVDLSNRLAVRAVVKNQPAAEAGQWILRPGMQVHMTILPR